MRTLVVDGLRAVGPRTAMGRYVERMASWWSRSPGPFDRIVFATPRPFELPDLGTAARIDVAVVAPRWPRLLWEQVALPGWARHASLLFCPSYTAPLVYPGRLVVANHGIYEAVPGEFDRWSRLRTTPLHRLSARRAVRLIANSGQTSKDMTRYFKVAASKIDVVYPAAGEVFFEERDAEQCRTEAAKVMGAAAPYVLFVGKLSRRRNVPNLIAAFAHVVLGHNLPHHLIVVGPDTSDISVPTVAQAHGVADRVHWVPHLEQAPLARLYAGAQVFALPTTYEGISWTMFEAMASGAPVFTVPHPTLDEGAGEAAYTVPSPAVEDLESGLLALLTDPQLRLDHAERGRRRATRFSWQVAAAATLRILDAVALHQDGGTVPGGTAASYVSRSRQ